MFADLFPTLFLLLLAAGVVWILWRLVRRLRRAPAARQEPSLDRHPEPHDSRPEPALRAVATLPSTIPDAADVLALKAAIDNLARQVAALERRLASGPVNQPAPPPSPPVRTTERPSALTQAPPIVADRRV
jgi:hypothetical protein